MNATCCAVLLFVASSAFAQTGTAGGGASGEGSTAIDAMLTALDEKPTGTFPLGDGSVLAFGGFTRIGPEKTPGRFARIKPDGTLGAAFEPPCSSLAVLAPMGQGRLFANAHCNSTLSDQRTPMVLDATGKKVAELPQCMNEIAIAPDGKGGVWGSCREPTRTTLVHLDVNGTPKKVPEVKFPHAEDQRVLLGTAVDSKGRAWFCGGAGIVNGVEMRGLMRTNADGTLDEAFTRAVAKNAFKAKDGCSLFVDSQDRALFIGDEDFVRILPDGAVDTAFDENLAKLEISGALYVMKPLRDGGVLIAGNFPRTPATKTASLVKVRADGTLDTAFAQNVAGALGKEEIVYEALEQADGRIVLAGEFGGFKESRARNLVRLMPDGKVDEAFSRNLLAGFDREVTLMTPLPGGEVLVSGEFSSAYSQPLLGLARFRKNGAFDAPWSAEFKETMQAERLYEIRSVKRAKTKGNLVLEFAAEDCAPMWGECVCEHFQWVEINSKGTVVGSEQGPENPDYSCEP